MFMRLMDEPSPRGTLMLTAVGYHRRESVAVSGSRWFDVRTTWLSPRGIISVLMVNSCSRTIGAKDRARVGAALGRAGYPCSWHQQLSGEWFAFSSRDFSHGSMSVEEARVRLDELDIRAILRDTARSQASHLDRNQRARVKRC